MINQLVLVFLLKALGLTLTIASLWYAVPSFITFLFLASAGITSWVAGEWYRRSNNLPTE